MQLVFHLVFGLIVGILIGAVVIVNIKYRSKVDLKFHNKEIDVTNVTFKYKNILEEK